MTRTKPRSSSMALRAAAPVLSIAVLILFWELLSRSGQFNALVLPPFSAVARSFWQWAVSGELAIDVAASLKRIVIGFSSAAVLGVAIGCVTARSNIFRLIALPVIQILRPVPPIAFVSLAIIWFGLGETSKYFLIFWGAFFPIWMAIYRGVLYIKPVYVWVAQSLGAQPADILRHVILPSAVPSIVTGLRIGLGISFVALIAAEMAGSFQGIGARISLSTSYFRSDIMLAALAVLGVLGAGCDSLLVMVTRYCFPWLRK